MQKSKVKPCQEPHRFHWHRLLEWPALLSMLMVATWAVLLATLPHTWYWAVVLFLSYAAMIWVVTHLRRWTS